MFVNQTQQIKAAHFTGDPPYRAEAPVSQGATFEIHLADTTVWADNNVSRGKGVARDTAKQHGFHQGPQSKKCQGPATTVLPGAVWPRRVSSRTFPGRSSSIRLNGCSEIGRSTERRVGKECDR